jgi:hypothetical protein
MGFLPGLLANKEMAQRSNPAHKDCAAFPSLLVVEFTSLSVKLAHNRRKIESTFVEIQLLRLRALRFGFL